MQAGWSVLNAKHQEISVGLYQLKHLPLLSATQKVVNEINQLMGFHCGSLGSNTILGALSFRWCSLKREGILEGSPYAIISPSWHLIPIQMLPFSFSFFLSND